MQKQKKDKFAKLVSDKITFKGNSYSYNRADELAKMLSFYSKGLRRGNSIIAFHGRSSIYSNFYPCKVREGTTTYNCTKQMYQHEKCLYFGDPQAARTVMLKMDPVAMKRIGDKVAQNDPERKKQWHVHKSRNIMKTAVYLKFSQNPGLLAEIN